MPTCCAAPPSWRPLAAVAGRPASAGHGQRRPSCGPGWAARCSAGPADPLSVVQALARAAEPGLVAIPSGRFFGFVIGGGLPPPSPPTGWLRLGPVPGFYACAPGRVGGRGGGRGLAAGLLGLPGGASFAFVTGCQMAALDLPGRGPPPRAGRGGLGRRGRRPGRGAADPGARGRGAARHHRPGAALPGPRLGRAHRRPRADGAPDAITGRAAGGTRRGRRRADDRLRPGWRGQHRRLRRPRRRRRRRRGGRGVAARRRRVRAVGGGQPGAAPPGRGAPSGPTRGRPTRTSG